MATYIVGDLHGCFNEFQLLLEKVNYNPKQDELFLTGDLVARGEDSLACLRFVKDSANNAKTVLGNHDLHLLGIKRVKPNDKIDAIFEAKDRLDLQNWLRNQPLVIHHPKHQFLLTHAGISPEWDLATTLACAKEAERCYKVTIMRTTSPKCMRISPNAGVKICKVLNVGVISSMCLPVCGFATPTSG